LSVKQFKLQMKREQETGWCSFRKKRKARGRQKLAQNKKNREEELKKSEGAILKFVNNSSDAISPNEMHEVSSASTSKSILEVEEETTPGKIGNNEEADVESNISKAYVAEVWNDDKTILPNGMSCSKLTRTSKPWHKCWVSQSWTRKIPGWRKTFRVDVSSEYK